MGKSITMEIPEQLLEGLDVDRSLVIQEIIQLGVYQFKVRRALEMYQARVGSLGYIAEKLGLSKRQLVEEARQRGLDPFYDEQTVQEDLAQ
jgi:predicted HTH domain antitoxin